MSPRSPQGRLHDMVAKHQLALLQEPNLAAARQLHDDEAAHARGVQALLSVQDYSGTLLLAYETGRKAALGLLLASGWRPTGGEGEHRITFEAAEYLVRGQAVRALSDAAYLRRLRNDNMYRQDRADIVAAEEAAAIAGQVAAQVLPILKAALDRANEPERTLRVTLIKHLQDDVKPLLSGRYTDEVRRPSLRSGC